MKLRLLQWALLLTAPNITLECPTWMKGDGNTSNNYTCGDTTREIVKCDEATMTVQILDGYLMTYNKEKHVVEAGQTI